MQSARQNLPNVLTRAANCAVRNAPAIHGAYVRTPTLSLLRKYGTSFLAEVLWVGTHVSANARYAAFISYSHFDKAVAKKIHKRLTTYRFPKGVVARNDRRIGRFFLDRENLPASGNLSDSLIDSLSQSDALIVVCSPAAVASKWVNQEIAEFRKLQPDGQILTAIVGGDPLAANSQNCFPKELVRGGLDPLAADFRPKGDGAKLALLKLAAALSGTPLQDLLRRDTMRRQRRIAGSVVASGFLAFIMSALAIQATRASIDANARRAEAEDLVDFMLGDLRRKLEPVGRLELMQDVGEKTLAYYETQDESQLSCEAAIRKARALHILNHVFVSQREFELALKPANSARDLMRKKLKDCLNNARVVQEASYAEAWAVNPYWQRAISHGLDARLQKQSTLKPGIRDDMESARDGYMRMLEVADTLRELPGQEWQHLQDTTEARMLLGAVLLRLDDIEGAKREFKAAHSAISSLVPDDLAEWDATKTLDANTRAAIQHYANSHDWLANVFERQENFSAAIEHYVAAEDLYFRLAGEGENKDWNAHREYLGMRLALARLERKRGNTAASSKIITELDTEIAALVRHDPTNSRWNQFADIVADFAKTELKKENDPK